MGGRVHVPAPELPTVRPREFPRSEVLKDSGESLDSKPDDYDTKESEDRHHGVKPVPIAADIRHECAIAKSPSDDPERRDAFESSDKHVRLDCRKGAGERARQTGAPLLVAHRDGSRAREVLMLCLIPP